MNRFFPSIAPILASLLVRVSAKTLGSFADVNWDLLVPHAQTFSTVFDPTWVSTLEF